MKTTFIVTFEPASEAERTAIREALKKFKGYCPIHKYCWAIRSEKTADAIRDEIQAVAPGTNIFVIRSGVAAAWKGLPGEKHDGWLKNYL